MRGAACVIVTMVAIVLGGCGAADGPRALAECGVANATAGRARVEIVPVALRDESIWYLAFAEDRSWQVPFDHHAHPHDVVDRAVRGSAVKAVHSTSWRYDHGTLILTYIAVLADSRSAPPGLTAVRVDDVSIARGGAKTPPPVIGLRAVVNHAMRHLAWLLRDDPAVRRALDGGWPKALSPYEPTPAMNLDELTHNFTEPPL